MWERGLKLIGMRLKSLAAKSLPMWERGLKHLVHYVDFDMLGRSPCGSVD